ncbi:MAG: TIGR02281 family clan AA aspartic protease [Alphaproteobacteria bacterium]
MNRRWAGTLAVIAVGAGALFLFRDKLGALDQEQMIRLSYLLLLAVLIGGSSLAFRDRVSVQLRNALLWLLILVGIVAVYSYRTELAGMFNPSQPRSVGETIELRRGEDGHFWADVDIDGVSTRMMIDTGATYVALAPRDARRLGIDMAGLRYVVPMSTANGDTFAAMVVLDSVSIGTLKVNDVQAAVMRENTGASLLGMSYLERLGGYAVEGEALRLRP